VFMGVIPILRGPELHMNRSPFPWPLPVSPETGVSERDHEQDGPHQGDEGKEPLVDDAGDECHGDD
jgi:hypothetical protein